MVSEPVSEPGSDTDIGGAMKKQALVLALTVAAAALTSVSAQVDLAKTAKLRNPAALKEKAPDVFKANLDTSKGLIVIEVHRDWAPNGADRFYNLVKNGFFDEARFYRVIPGFMAQFGMNGNPAVTKAWDGSAIPDDPVKQSNTRGMVSFAATSAPNSRTTNLFINYGNNARLDASRFAPFGKVVTGMDVADKINAEYREGPQQDQIRAQGNAYLTKSFPKLDYIKTATIAQ
jgi:peptidyl-prolyl cis-trans isomerase A (cyclophilin A)